LSTKIKDFHRAGRKSDAPWRKEDIKTEEERGYWKRKPTCMFVNDDENLKSIDSNVGFIEQNRPVQAELRREQIKRELILPEKYDGPGFDYWDLNSYV
jgi:hypothetical protein